MVYFLKFALLRESQEERNHSFLLMSHENDRFLVFSELITIEKCHSIISQYSVMYNLLQVIANHQTSVSSQVQMYN